MNITEIKQQLKNSSNLYYKNIYNIINKNKYEIIPELKEYIEYINKDIQSEKLKKEIKMLFSDIEKEIKNIIKNDEESILRIFAEETYSFKEDNFAFLDFKGEELINYYLKLLKKEAVKTKSLEFIKNSSCKENKTHPQNICYEILKEYIKNF